MWENSGLGAILFFHKIQAVTPAVVIVECALIIFDRAWLPGASKALPDCMSTCKER